MVKRVLTLVCTALAALAIPLAAQDAAPDSAAPVAARAVPRASWLSDQRGFAVGEILTVVVDEQTTASEKTNATSSATRSQTNQLNVASGSSAPTTMAFATGQDAQSNNSGVAGRQGQLSATLSVRVVRVNADGSLQIEGRREVVMDGRKQEMKLTGLVRPQDVSPQNVVLSSRIAGASISYNGNTMAAKRGLLGRILAIIWP